VIRGAHFGNHYPKALLHILEVHEEKGNSNMLLFSENYHDRKKYFGKLGFRWTAVLVTHNFP
jgi:hypothetical protein